MNNKRIFTLIIFLILYFGKVSAQEETVYDKIDLFGEVLDKINKEYVEEVNQSDTMDCLLYTSPSPRDRQKSRMPSSA